MCVLVWTHPIGPDASTSLSRSKPLIITYTPLFNGPRMFSSTTQTRKAKKFDQNKTKSNISATRRSQKHTRKIRASSVFAARVSQHMAARALKDTQTHTHTWDFAVFKDQLAGVWSPHAEFVELLRCRESRHSLRNTHTRAQTQAPLKMLWFMLCFPAILYHIHLTKHKAGSQNQEFTEGVNTSNPLSYEWSQRERGIHLCSLYWLYLFNNERCDSSLMGFGIRLCINNENISIWSICDPELVAIQNIIVTCLERKKGK